jgi:small-conductance mechanosensitive channel
MDFSLSKLGADLWLALQRWVVDHGAKTVIILVAALVALRLSRAVGRRLVNAASDHDDTTNTEREKRAATLSQVINTIARISVWLVAGLMIVREIGMDIGPILAGAGVAGLAVGFGAQSLVKDWFSGFFLLIEDQVRVGDVVEAAGHSGQVERVTLRTTVLRDLSGALHVIPNGQIATLSNLTYGWSRAVLDVSVSYRENLDHVFKIMRQVGQKLRSDPEFSRFITSDLEILGVDSFGESALFIKAHFRTEPQKQWLVAREYRRRLKSAFDAEHIEIPFPHRTVYHRLEEPLAMLSEREMRGRAGKYGWSVLEDDQKAKAESSTPGEI